MTNMSDLFANQQLNRYNGPMGTTPADMYSVGRQPVNIPGLGNMGSVGGMPQVPVGNAMSPAVIPKPVHPAIAALQQAQNAAAPAQQSSGANVLMDPLQAQALFASMILPAMTGVNDGVSKVADLMRARSQAAAGDQSLPPEFRSYFQNQLARQADDAQRMSQTSYQAAVAAPALQNFMEQVAAQRALQQQQLYAQQLAAAGGSSGGAVDPATLKAKIDALTK